MEGSPNGGHTHATPDRWLGMAINRIPSNPSNLTAYPVCRLGSWLLVPDRWNRYGEKRVGYLCNGSARVRLAHSCDILVEFVQALYRLEEDAWGVRTAPRTHLG